MLTDEQIGYLLQIRDTKPALGAQTVRIMLGALRWSDEEIEKGLEFLKIPPAPENVKPTTPETYKEPPNPEVLSPKPINIKQNPFPIGSPLINGPSKREGFHKIKINPVIGGLIVGCIVFIIILIIDSEL
jgi:hypothetical protein